MPKHQPRSLWTTDTLKEYTERVFTEHELRYVALLDIAKAEREAISKEVDILRNRVVAIDSGARAVSSLKQWGLAVAGLVVAIAAVVVTFMVFHKP